MNAHHLMHTARVEIERCYLAVLPLVARLMMATALAIYAVALMPKLL